MTSFKTSQNAVQSKGETNSGRIITVPDQTVSTRELLTKMSSGVPVNTRYPVYNPDYYGADIKAMDLIDVQEAKVLLQSRINQNKDKLDEIKEEINRRKTNVSPKEESDKSDS